MYILGINAYHGDAAAAIIKDGRLIAAVEEERFNRCKHSAGFPAQAIQYCLEAAGIRARRSGPRRNLARSFSAPAQEDLVCGDARCEPRAGKSRIDWVMLRRCAISRTNSRACSASQKNNCARDFITSNIIARISPVASTSRHSNAQHCYRSMGLATSFPRCGRMVKGTRLQVLGQVEYPHSTGIVYTATTQFLGFPHYGDEGKVMGLAPYGRPRFINEFREIIRTEENGQFRLNLDYFRHHSEGVEMTWDQGSPVIGRIFSDEFAHLFGPPRAPGAALTDRERDIAASLQLRLEEVGFHVLNHLHEQTGLTDLGLAGGVAYNSVMNGKILLNTPFKRLFIQPAAGDSGTALGVCYQIYNGILNGERARSDDWRLYWSGVLERRDPRRRWNRARCLLNITRMKN